jgi:hypothetical protein
MDIEEVSITILHERTNGVPAPSPYSLEATVDGLGLAAAFVQTPNGTVLPLTMDDGDWVLRLPGFATLCAIETALGFGTFTFIFVPVTGNVESARVTWNLTCTTANTSYPRITFPPHGATVVVNPTFTWGCAGGTCPNYAWYFEVSPVSGGGTSYEGEAFAQFTNWAPGVLSFNTQYLLWVSAATQATQLAGQWITTTPGNDGFSYEARWESTNQAAFFTGSTSAAACIPFNGTGINPTGFACASNPVLGMNWISTIPTAPATIETYLGIGGTPAVIPFLGGEILIGLVPSFFVPSNPAPGMHSILIPNLSSLFAVSLPTQGFRVDGPAGAPALVLFNGQIVMPGL